VVANLARTKQAKNYAIQRKLGDIYPAKVGGVDGNDRKYTKNYINYNQQNHIRDGSKVLVPIRRGEL